MKQKVQLLSKEITAEGSSVSISEELDRNYSHLTGISILDKIGTGNLFNSSSIDSRELFPKNFEVGFIQSNSSVAPNERFFSLSETKAAGNKIEIEFTDGGTAPSYPYTLHIYLKLNHED